MTSDNSNNNSNDNNSNDTRQTAMLIFRDEGVDWAKLAADGRSKALFQKLVDWAADLKRRGVYAGVEALAQSGKTVRVRGKGIPRASGDPGALLVTFDVVVPTHLDDDERALVEQLGDKLSSGVREHLGV